MFISNLTHFLDKKGNIPADMPKEGREMEGFLAIIVDTATKDYPPSTKSTNIRCIKKKSVLFSQSLYACQTLNWPH